jgi:hypothetical protein
MAKNLSMGSRKRSTNWIRSRIAIARRYMIANPEAPLIEAARRSGLSESTLRGWVARVKAEKRDRSQATA